MNGLAGPFLAAAPRLTFRQRLLRPLVRVGDASVAPDIAGPATPGHAL
jgi:hypothetical protein